MTLELHCNACGALLIGEPEEELAANVREHAEGHGHSRPISIEHIRSRLNRETSQEHKHEREH